MTAGNVPLSLFHGSGRPADDPAIVQVWAAYLEGTGRAEAAAARESCQAVRAAFTDPMIRALRLAHDAGSFTGPGGVS